MLNALCSVPFLSPPQGGRNFTDVINVDSCVVSAVCGLLPWSSLRAGLLTKLELDF